jgi:hypothetical protein
MDKKDLKNLQKRYLIWLYKVTKEAFDRIERKFTQLEVDRFLLKELKKDKNKKLIRKQIDEFKDYILKKESDGLSLKYSGAQLSSGYHFLTVKLKAIEKAIVKEFGRKELSRIKSLFEEEFTKRILKSTEH